MGEMGERARKRSRRNEGEGGKTRTGSRTYRQKETKDREQAREVTGKKRGMQIHRKRWRRKKPRWPAGQRETGKKEAQGAGKRGNKESKRRGRMTEPQREMENRERGDREQSTIPERKRVTWKQKKLHRGKGEGAVRDWDTEEG